MKFLGWTRSKSQKELVLQVPLPNREQGKIIPGLWFRRALTIPSWGWATPRLCFGLQHATDYQLHIGPQIPNVCLTMQPINYLTSSWLSADGGSVDVPFQEEWSTHLLITESTMDRGNQHGLSLAGWEPLHWWNKPLWVLPHLSPEQLQVLVKQWFCEYSDPLMQMRKRMPIPVRHEAGHGRHSSSSRRPTAKDAKSSLDTWQCHRYPLNLMWLSTIFPIKISLSDMKPLRWQIKFKMATTLHPRSLETFRR